MSMISCKLHNADLFGMVGAGAQRVPDGCMMGIVAGKEWGEERHLGMARDHIRVRPWFLASCLLAFREDVDGSGS